MKSVRYLLGFALAIIGFFSTGFYGDDERLTTLIDKLELFTQKNPQEKVHIHFDKPFYSVGDNMWLKAYVVNAEENKLSILSSVLHVDLIDERDSIRTFLFPLQDGLASGNIDLVDSVFAAGTYELRAYTRWMENYDPDYFFTKTITIGDALNGTINANAKFNVNAGNEGVVLGAEVAYTDLKGKPEASKTVSYQLNYKGKPLTSGQGKTDEQGKFKLRYLLKKEISAKDIELSTILIQNQTAQVARNFRVNNGNQDIDLRFFPEGGSLVVGLRSKVAFKAVGSDGMSMKLKGHIEDEQKNRIVDLETEHAGMGLFALTPELGKSYTAVIKLENGAQQRYQLPKAVEQGYVLNLNHLDDESLALRVDCSKEMVQNQEIVIIAQSNGITKHVSKIKMDKSVLISKLPKKLVGSGIIQFTLFSPEYLPMAERLIFVMPHNSLTTTFNLNKPAYGKKEKVGLDMKIASVGGKGVVGSFSVSVVNQDKVKVEEEDEVSIYSNLLLTSDLKGFIERPNYYFTSTNPQKVRELDLLMLTQGWRRFKWKDVQQGKNSETKFLPEKGLSISGKITTLGNKPIPFGKINLFVPTMMALIDTVADANGRFVFDHLVFADSTHFILRAKSEKYRNNVKIVLDVNTPVPFKTTTKRVSETTQTAFANYLYHTEKRYNEMDKFGIVNRTVQLRTVEITDRRLPLIARSKVPELVRPDFTLTPAQMESSTSVTELLRGKAGIWIENNRIYGYGVNRTTKRYSRGPMLVLLDGMPLTNVNEISAMQLAGIQVIKGGMASESTGATFPRNDNPRDGTAEYGIVFLTLETKRTKYNTKGLYGVSHVKPLGYAVTKEFYVPRYDAGNKLNDMQDLRSTIFWKPNLITDEDGKLNMDFYTADEPGRYLVTLEGLSLNGELARQQFSFLVK